MLSDRVGRRPVYPGGAIGAAVLVAASVAPDPGSTALIVLAMVVTVNVFQMRRAVVR